MNTQQEERPRIKPREFQLPYRNMKAVIATALINGGRKFPLIRPRSSLPFSILTYKTLSLLLGQVKVTKDKAFAVFEITAAELWRAMGSHYHPTLDTVVGVMVECASFVLLAHDKNNKSNEWHTVRLVDEARFDSEAKLLRLQLSKQLIPYVLGLKQEFTQQYVLSVMKFRSVSAALLYGLIRQFVGFTTKQIHRVSVQDLFVSLHIDPRDYDKHLKNWWVFERDILRPSIKQVLSKTELRFEYHIVRSGSIDRRRGPVEAIVFSNVREVRLVESSNQIHPPVVIHHKKEQEDTSIYDLRSPEGFRLVPPSDEDEKEDEEMLRELHKYGVPVEDEHADD